MADLVGTLTAIMGIAGKLREVTKKIWDADAKKHREKGRGSLFGSAADNPGRKTRVQRKRGKILRGFGLNT